MKHRNSSIGSMSATKPTDTLALAIPGFLGALDEVPPATLLKGKGAVAKISAVVVNPKSADQKVKPLLKDVLALYNEELPSMGYAANTGKKSQFLEKCVTNGKYCTLLFTEPTSDGKVSVVAAITYKIIPADTQYAEIPLAAVQRGHQRKGLGTALYQELHMRLQNVGVLTTFCWGDQESEKFWVKQGFCTIAEVDSRGRPQNLRLKADVRKAMCMPGSATLMVCKTGGTATEKKLVHGASKLGYRQCLEVDLAQVPHSVESCRTSPSFSIATPVLEAPKPAFWVTPSESSCDRKTNPAAGKFGLSNLTPLNIAGAFARVASKAPLNDVENITPRGTPKEARRMPLELTVTGSPSTFRDNVLLDVTNVAPKPGSQLFAALCDVASSLADQAEDQPDRNDEGSATREEQRQCAIQMPEQSCNVSQENQRASCEHLPEEPMVKHTRGTLRTYKKRSCATKAIVAKVPDILTTKGGLESFRPDQCTITENINSSTAVSERSTRKRAKKRRSAGGDQTSADQTKEDNAGEVNPRVLRSSSTDKRKRGLIPSAPRAGQRSHKLVSMGKDSDSQIVALALPPCEDKTHGHCGEVHLALDVSMTEAAECPQMQIPDLSVLSDPSKACSDGRTGEQVDKLSMAEGLDENRKPSLDSVMCYEDVQVSTECIKTAMDVTENTTGDSMALSIDAGGATELIASEHCFEQHTTYPECKKAEHVVMFMNMANETRRKQLTQFVEQLGGEVTGKGIECTIVVTGEVRTTLNFCAALCAGAWVVSSNWLRDSVRKKKFVDPAFYILHDKTFEMTYEGSVQEVVLRARQNPKSLLKGFHLYPTPNVTPNLETIVQLIIAAGGKVLTTLQEALASEDPSHTIILACEEDTVEALEVSPRGMWVFSVDWFMSCIIRQDLDLSKPQFAEPLY